MARKKDPAAGQQTPPAILPEIFDPAKEAEPQSLQGPAESDDWFSDTVEEIVVRRPAMIGRARCEVGMPLAEVRLARGLTISQLCAAIRQGKAGEAPPG